MNKIEIGNINYIVKLKKFEDGLCYAAVNTNSDVVLLTAGDMLLLDQDGENRNLLESLVIEPNWKN